MNGKLHLNLFLRKIPFQTYTLVSFHQCILGLSKQLQEPRAAKTQTPKLVMKSEQPAGVKVLLHQHFVQNL